MSLKSTLKATTLGVMSLFMASKADAQTQQADSLKLDASLTPSNFVDPVIKQYEFGNQGHRGILIYDKNKQGNPSEVTLIVKDDGDLIVKPDEVVDAYMTKFGTFWQNGAMKVIQSYDSGARNGEPGKRGSPNIFTQYIRENGEAVREPTIEKTTKDVIIYNALRELNHN